MVIVCYRAGVYNSGVSAKRGFTVYSHRVHETPDVLVVDLHEYMCGLLLKENDTKANLGGICRYDYLKVEVEYAMQKWGVMHA